MIYLRTKLGTDFKPMTLIERVIGAVTFFIPKANPGYDGKLHLVREWLIEFDDAGLPDREIGLDANRSPILGGPDERNHGFWLDTNMSLKDFVGEPIDEALFEAKWNELLGAAHTSVWTRR